MSLPPMLLDTIAKVTGPSLNESVSRVFVFAEHEGQPSFASIYVGKNGKPFLLSLELVASFTSTRYPRREPYRVVTESGEEWTIFKGGCGCGSPIRRLSSRQALDDYATYSASQPVGG